MSNQSEDRRIHDEIHALRSGSDPFAAAMRATRMPMLITDPRLPDNPIVFVNDAFARLTGYTREETLGRNCRFLQGPGTNLEDVARIREAIEKLEPVELSC
ncbi:MAG TPA: PAS domain-containing protein [Devosia sp.]|jgi:PAS domain S-box-containing protein|nr:PAS domain-containing protein [Devosia sp.]